MLTFPYVYSIPSLPSELLASPRPVHCCTCGLTHYLYCVTGLVSDNGYVAVLLNVGASYALFIPEIYSPCRYDIVTRAPHYFAIESVRLNSLIHVYPFALNHSVMGLRFECIAKFGGISPTRKPMKRWWLNFTCGLLLNFVTFIVIIIIFKCYKYIINTCSCLVCNWLFV